MIPRPVRWRSQLYRPTVLLQRSPNINPIFIVTTDGDFMLFYIGKPFEHLIYAYNQDVRPKAIDRISCNATSQTFQFTDTFGVGERFVLSRLICFLAHAKNLSMCW